MGYWVCQRVAPPDRVNSECPHHKSQVKSADMKPQQFIIRFFQVFVIFGLLLSAAHAAESSTPLCTVTRVVDGDTLYVQCPGQNPSRAARLRDALAKRLNLARSHLETCFFCFGIGPADGA